MNETNYSANDNDFLLESLTTKNIDKGKGLLIIIYEHMIKLHSIKNNLQNSDWIRSIKDARNSIIDFRIESTKNFDKELIKYQDKAFKEGLKKANNANDMVHMSIYGMYSRRPDNWSYENIMDTRWMTKFITENIVSEECSNKFYIEFKGDIEYRGN